MKNPEFLTKCMNIPKPENRCHICGHYNMTHESCHLQNMFGYCDFKPIHIKDQADGNEERIYHSCTTDSINVGRRITDAY